ncbi:MAG: ABC transporter substrate-binding protein [Rubellimicrobium sp.]|nr:ABC transporter substrate-binding protein [Rubellimicrobium sp.]
MISRLHRLGRAGAAILALLAAGALQAEPQHGIAMYGTPALPADYDHLPYADPAAPVGGRIVTAEVGSFDSLNPYVRKGSVPWQLTYLVSETLMGRSLDEPFSLYGLLAESMETDPERRWVEFTLRPEARFSDGNPVTVADVIWSYETLGTQGHGRYASFWAQVESIEQTGERSLRITFNTPNRELVLLAGLRPVLERAQWEGVDFAESDGLAMIPITPGPYVVADFEAGRFVELRRNPDYWGWDVPFRRGTMNIETIRYEFFGDETAAFEAFKTGEVNLMRETNVARWQGQYDFPLVRDGSIVLDEVAHQRPTGMTGLVMNTRDPVFADWRVRDAMLLAFNFDQVNDAMTGGQSPRIGSYFANSPLGMTPGAPAEGRVRELLEPFAADLVPGTIEGYELPQGDGTAANRADLGRAMAQLEAAGWSVDDAGVLRDGAGAPFAFTILLQTGASETLSIAEIYAEALRRLGMEVTIEQVDSAQYTERIDALDFDMTYYRVGLSLSPGNEQYLYFGSEQADTGGRNLMGVKSPVVDALIGQILNAPSQEDFRAAVQALDRVLTAGRYVVPFYQWNVARIAHARDLHYPDHIPLFGDWPGWQPDVWWSDAGQ